MPLSEHERRQLEQIEQALRADDPRFADAVHAADPRVHYKRRVIAAALGLVIGVGLLLAGVVINVIPVAVAGFVVIARLQPVGGDQLPADDRAAPPGAPPLKGGGAGKERRGCGRAGWQAGGPGADGAAGGALAAPPGGRPLSPGLVYPHLAASAARRSRGWIVRRRSPARSGRGGIGIRCVAQSIEFGRRNRRE